MPDPTPPPTMVPASAPGELPLAVTLRRSGRRKRTVKWQMHVDPTIVRVDIEVPASLTLADEATWRDRIVRAVRDRLTRLRRQDAPDLNARARKLAATYLGPTTRLVSASWSTRQQARWGSCSPDTAAIRLSARLQSLPAWVVDYVLVHELAHLLEPAHNDRFWALVNRYPLAERARGFLAGYDFRGDPHSHPDSDSEALP